MSAGTREGAVIGGPPRRSGVVESWSTEVYGDVRSSAEIEGPMRHDALNYIEDGSAVPPWLDGVITQTGVASMHLTAPVMQPGSATVTCLHQLAAVLWEAKGHLLASRDARIVLLAALLRTAPMMGERGACTEQVAAVIRGRFAALAGRGTLVVGSKEPTPQLRGMRCAEASMASRIVAPELYRAVIAQVNEARFRAPSERERGFCDSLELLDDQLPTLQTGEAGMQAHDRALSELKTLSAVKPILFGVDKYNKLRAASTIRGFCKHAGICRWGRDGVTATHVRIADALGAAEGAVRAGREAVLAEFASAIRHESRIGMGNAIRGCHVLEYGNRRYGGSCDSVVGTGLGGSRALVFAAHANGGGAGRRLCIAAGPPAGDGVA